MSYDLYFWKAGTAEDPAQLAEQLADEEAADVPPVEEIVVFRAAILRRWPELADMISPWHSDLGWRQPWGRTDLGDRFVGLTLPFSWSGVADLPELAKAHGLDCYDPQTDELV